MTTKDMMSYYVLGITDIIDTICDNFSAADFTSEDLKEYICLCVPNHLGSVGNMIISRLYNDIVDDAVERYGMDKSKFDFYVDGMASCLTYNHDNINSEKDLQKYES